MLYETRHSNVYWIEEAFHEDDVMYKWLKEWLAKTGIKTLIADGEGGSRRSPKLVEWARRGLIDVLQPDIVWDGFVFWLKYAKMLEEYNILAAPHNFGSTFGNYATCQIFPFIKTFTLAEWDEADIKGMDFSNYSYDNGYVVVGDKPGFGIDMDDELYEKTVAQSGWMAK